MMKRPNPYIDLPLTVGRVLAMVLSVVVYVSQLVYGSILGFCWFTCGRKTDAKRERYHRAMWRFFRFDLRSHPWLYANIHNPHGEDFHRGAILICNHQSLLDTLCLFILSPRILLVTHDRVWNNPLVAAVLRYADCFSVSDTGWDDRLEYCRSFLDKGYSIAVFPEGCRSQDGNVQRFHKGAFYLAERLEADILPVFIHGAAHVMPVGTTFANRGGFDIEIGRRIPPNALSFGSGYVERCREVHRYYVAHYEDICRRVETPDYFRSLVIGLYASVGLGCKAKNVLDGARYDAWDVLTLVDALVHPECTYTLPASSPLRRIYDKYTHLPQNITFV
ncbi:MAG TPA: 1-acyl-sn-glycerol-3-phosphate acyltransferase [Candidatus Bacteroides pullicola]|uniref:1-acyl-sn-glycerol-3-phosphate acyltransferase n=1 Tax=Candidatus Bacteroides pullicola TaxID=2838475 RepID=A0A9D1ZIM8_9BACE|nr:1-acyl-sn-glycerol-3-phosphate acyltransferase [Candidatus Bacteroides pullicola]